MRRMLLGAMVVASLGVTGCRTLARQAFANPVVEVKDVKVKGVGVQGGSLDLILDVYNPNDYRIDTRRLSYEVWVDSSQVATGELDKLVTLSNQGHSEVVVPVNFTYAAVQKAVVAFAMRGSVNYRVKGAFTMATPFGDISRPYSGTGRIDSFR